MDTAEFAEAYARFMQAKGEKSDSGADAAMALLFASKLPRVPSTDLTSVEVARILWKASRLMKEADFLNVGLLLAPPFYDWQSGFSLPPMSVTPVAYCTVELALDAVAQLLEGTNAQQDPDQLPKKIASLLERAAQILERGDARERFLFLSDLGAFIKEGSVRW